MVATVSRKEPLPGGRVPDSWILRCGQLDESDWPKHLRPLRRWHLCSVDGTPMHYIANTLFLAGDKDCWGLRKGETRQYKNRAGELTWEPCHPGPPVMYGPTCPPPYTKGGVVIPYRAANQVGEGKARELDAARRAASWPEATDEELINATEETLMARLPALQAQFRAECARYLDGP